MKLFTYSPPEYKFGELISNSRGDVTTVLGVRLGANWEYEVGHVGNFIEQDQLLERYPITIGYV